MQTAIASPAESYNHEDHGWRNRAPEGTGSMADALAAVSTAVTATELAPTPIDPDQVTSAQEVRDYLASVLDPMSVGRRTEADHQARVSIAEEQRDRAA